MTNNLSPMYRLTTSTWLSCALAVGCWTAAGGHATAEESDPKPPAGNSLDHLLLDDLDSQLLDELDDVPLPKPHADRPPLEQHEGQDVQPDAADDPFTRIGRQMRMVERLIGERKTASETQQLQHRIVADLDALIEQLKQQQRQRGEGQSEPQAGQGGGEDQSGEGADDPGSSPARESTDRLGQGDQEREDLQELHSRAQQVWGHLPERLRQQMQNVTAEQFLPQYEKLIEQYYQRLVEEGRNSP